MRPAVFPKIKEMLVEINITLLRSAFLNHLLSEGIKIFSAIITAKS